ncbi:MAG TPA: trigger factor [Chloroflexota bacterium]|nr:trigger factor [Chloroflexota bacterium]
MNAVVERAEHSQVTLKVEVEPERLAKATDKAYQRLVQRVTIPGFRKGKAPRKILERAVGVDALYREALDFVMPDAYREAVKETGIAPYTQPEFEVVELEPEKPLVFKATVPVQPTVKLGDYKSIKLEAPDLTITEQEVDEAVENLRQSHAELVPVPDRPAKVGDQATLDVITSLDGRRLSDEARETVAELDAEHPLPSWANALAGLKVGDAKDVEDHIPDDYRDSNLAGKIATYSVTVKEIKERQLPDVDDELARSVGDYDDLAALRADLRKRLEAQKKAHGREQYESDLVDKLIEISEIEYPAVMVDQELEQMLREADNNFRRQGFSLDMFLRGTKKSVDDLTGEWRPRGERRVKSALVLKELIGAEELKLDPGKLEAELNRMVEDTPADRRADVRKLVATERVRGSVEQELLLRNALDVLDRLAGGEQFVELEGVQ